MIKRSIITALVSVSGLISFCFFSDVFAADRDEARLELKTPPDKNLSPFTGYTREQFAVIHPAGAVGERLIRGERGRGGTQ